MATGNVLIEGNQYTARAARASYTEAKDLLILEGDGHTDARLFRQQYVGGPLATASGRTIQYWPRLDRVSGAGIQSVEMNQLPKD